MTMRTFPKGTILRSNYDLPPGIYYEVVVVSETTLYTAEVWKVVGQANYHRTFSVGDEVTDKSKKMRGTIIAIDGGEACVRWEYYWRRPEYGMGNSWLHPAPGTQLLRLWTKTEDLLPYMEIQ